MKCVNLLAALLLIGYTELLAENPEDLQKVTTNILAGKVGKTTPPVSGASQKTVGENDVDEEESGDNNDAKPRSSKKHKSEAKRKPAYNYRDELILNWIYRSNNMIAKTDTSGSSVRSVAFKGQLDKNSSKRGSDLAIAKSDKTSAQRKNSKSFRLSGFCIIPDPVEIAGNSKGVLAAYCETAKGNFKLVGDLLPKPEEYSLSGSALYVEDTNQKRYYPDANKSRILNSRKNSANIATFVNTYALDKVVRESVKNSSKNIASTATQYMQDLKASRTTQETTLVANAGATTSTNTTKPVASDYVTILGIQMTADLVDKWADYAFQEHPWGFMILGGSKIYMDLSVQEEIK